MQCLVLLYYWGITSSIGLFVTTITNYFLVIEDCRTSTSSSPSIVGASYCITDILTATSIIVFALCTYRTRKQISISKQEYNEKAITNENRCNCKKCGWIFIIVTTTLALATSIIAGYRAHGYIELNKYCNMTEVKQNKVIVIGFHAFLKWSSLSSTPVINLLAMFIFQYFGVVWITNGSLTSEIKPIKLPQSTQSLTHEVTQNISQVADDKFYILQMDYKKRGRRIKYGCNPALQQWFALMFLTYFLLVLTTMVQEIGTIAQQEWLNIANLICSVAQYFISFLGPYIMGKYLNKLHNRYYRHILEEYWALEVTIEGPKNITFECRQGNDIKVKHGQSDAATWELAKKLYKQYYLKTMDRKLIDKADEFDFIPSILYTTIPLNSQGYIALLIGLIFVALKIT